MALVGRAKSLIKHKQYLMIMISILLLCIIFFVAKTIENHNSLYPKLTYAQLSSRINTDSRYQKYEDEINLINSQNTAVKNNLYIQTDLAQAYLWIKNYTSALQVYKSIANKYGMTMSLAEGAANSAVQIKDYKDAIYYYQQAIAINKTSDNQLTQSYANYYYDQINKLKILETKS